MRGRSPATGATQCGVFNPRKTLRAPALSRNERSASSAPSRRRATPSWLGSSRVRRSFPVHELASRFGSLKQQGDGELGAVEIPAELLTLLVAHGIHPGQRIRHRIQARHLHGLREKFRERRPLVDAENVGSVHLVGADRSLRRGHSPQGGMICFEPIHVITKVDVVFTGVGEGVILEDRSEFRRRARNRVCPHEAVEIEHAVLMQRATAAFHRRKALGIVEPVERISLEVENGLDTVFHGCVLS